MSTASFTRSRFGPALLGFGTLAGFIVLMQALIYFGVLNQFIVPYPTDIARAFERVVTDAPEQWWAIFFPIWPDLEAEEALEIPDATTAPGAPETPTP